MTAPRQTRGEMSAASASPLRPHIESRILALHAQRVMLDADLALLYGVQTKVLVQAVKRNAARFPADFMFQLDAAEWAGRGKGLRPQSATLESPGGRNLRPQTERMGVRADVRA